MAESGGRCPIEPASWVARRPRMPTWPTAPRPDPAVRVLAGEGAVVVALPRPVKAPLVGRRPREYRTRDCQREEGDPHHARHCHALAPAGRLRKRRSARARCPRSRGSSNAGVSRPARSELADPSLGLRLIAKALAHSDRRARVHPATTTDNPVRCERFVVRARASVSLIGFVGAPRRTYARVGPPELRQSRSLEAWNYGWSNWFGLLPLLVAVVQSQVLRFC